MQRINLNLKIIINLFSIFGIISAITFSGYQAYYLRKEFILNTRPYIQIDSKTAELETKVLGIVIKREDYFLAYSFEKNKHDRLIIPIYATNVGKSPALLKEAVITIKSGESNKEFFISNVIKNDDIRRFVVFPNESVCIGLDITRKPNTQYIIENQGGNMECYFSPPQFNKWCNELQESLKKEDFICEVMVKYGFLDEVHYNKSYTTYKVWVIKPGGKVINPHHYYVN